MIKLIDNVGLFQLYWASKSILVHCVPTMGAPRGAAAPLETIKISEFLFIHENSVYSDILRIVHSYN